MDRGSTPVEVPLWHLTVKDDHSMALAVANNIHGPQGPGQTRAVGEMMFNLGRSLLERLTMEMVGGMVDPTTYPKDDSPDQMRMTAILQPQPDGTGNLDVRVVLGASCPDLNYLQCQLVVIRNILTMSHDLVGQSLGSRP